MDHDINRKIEEFIRRNKWIFAKTYAESAPHEYIVKEKLTRDDQKFFEEYVAYIRKNGFAARFWDQEHLYYELGGRYYWTMGDPIEENSILNRCYVNDYETKNGVMSSRRDRNDGTVLLRAVMHNWGLITGNDIHYVFYEVCLSGELHIELYSNRLISDTTTMMKESDFSRLREIVSGCPQGTEVTDAEGLDGVAWEFMSYDQDGMTFYHHRLGYIFRNEKLEEIASILGSYRPSYEKPDARPEYTDEMILEIVERQQILTKRMQAMGLFLSPS